MIQDYDIIGDIHGHADKLSELLQILDYRREDGCYTGNYYRTRQVELMPQGALALTTELGHRTIIYNTLFY